MATSAVDQVMTAMEQSAGHYHRLVLIVGPSGSGKTAILKEVASRTGSRRVNLNLELSKRLLELTSRQRVLQIRNLIEEIVVEAVDDAVLFDNIELLFDRSLEQDPLRLLQGISRNRTIAAAWNGTVENGELTYATPDHHEYRRYSTDETLVIVLGPVS